MQSLLSQGPCRAFAARSASDRDPIDEPLADWSVQLAVDLSVVVIDERGVVIAPVRLPVEHGHQLHVGNVVLRDADRITITSENAADWCTGPSQLQAGRLPVGGDLLGGAAVIAGKPR